MFYPKPISDTIFHISDRILGEMTQKEISLVRQDMLLGIHPLHDSIINILAALDSLSTLRVDGHAPDSRAFFSLFRDECRQRADMSESTLEAKYYRETLEWVSANFSANSCITPRDILEFHSRCRFGKSQEESGSDFRSNRIECHNKYSRIVYVPPSPEDIPAFLEDLCVFLNRECFSPNIQAAIGHFQLESIKPFKTAMDRTGRVLVHTVLLRRGLVQSPILPIALLPAIGTKVHARLLLPYETGSDLNDDRSKSHALNNWLHYCAACVGVAADVTKHIMDLVSQLHESWHVQLGSVSKGSLTEELLRLLPGTPYITVRSVQEETGRSFSAVNDAINRLRQVGILMEAKDVTGQTRVFEAKSALDIFEQGLGFLLHTDPIPRDSFFEK
jgi:Fic family protein